MAVQAPAGQSGKGAAVCHPAPGGRGAGGHSGTAGGVGKPGKNLPALYELLIDIEQIPCENLGEVEVASVSAGLTLSREDVSTG